MPALGRMEMQPLKGFTAMKPPEGLTTAEYQAIVADAAADARVTNLLSLGFGLVLDFGGGVSCGIG